MGSAQHIRLKRSRKRIPSLADSGHACLAYGEIVERVPRQRRGDLQPGAIMELQSFGIVFSVFLGNVSGQITRKKDNHFT